MGKLHKILQTLVSCLSVVSCSLFSLEAKTTLDDLPLLNLDDFFQERGEHRVDVWNDLSNSANPNGGSYNNSTYMWPDYGAQISTAPAGEEASLVKVSNAPGGGGGAYFATSSIYFWGGTSSTSAGTLAVRASSPMNNLRTLTLQLEIGEAEGRDLYSLPSLTLTFQDGTSSVIDFVHGGIIDFVPNGTFEPPGSGLPPQDMYINLWGFQWDVSNYTNIASVSVSFSAVGHSSLRGIQMDQSDYNFGNESIFDYRIPVPEPSVYALLLGAGALGVVALRRRRMK